MSPEPRPTSLPIEILIHPTVWPQYTNVTDRADTGQWYHRGEPLLVTVAQKAKLLSIANITCLRALYSGCERLVSLVPYHNTFTDDGTV